MFKCVQPLAGKTFQEEFRSTGWCKENSDGQKTVAEDRVNVRLGIVQTEMELVSWNIPTRKPTSGIRAKRDFTRYEQRSNRYSNTSSVMSANDDFSLNDDEELSLHDDASLAGSKRVTKERLVCSRLLPPTTQQKQVADEKERKARTLLLMAVPKDHLRRFHDMDDAKEIWAAIKTRLAMTMRTKKILNTRSIDNLYINLSVFEQDIQKTSSSSLTSDNVAFLSQAKASSSKHKPHHNSGSYSSYTTSSSKATPTATPGLADEVIHSFLATNADDVDLIHEDLDQIDDLDLEEMDINWQIAMTAIKIKKFYKKTGRRPRVDGKMHVAFDKRKVECFNCHNTGHFARECKFKGTKDGSRQEASRGQDFKPVRTEKEALMTIDEGQINWVEQTTDEEINHALMAFTVNNEVFNVL
ncbi:ribonuclease H-like domain-containing protein [Tanacetum coccineum]